MSGGEESAIYWQQTTTELEGFVKCEVSHCQWHVHLPARRCFEHGGPRADQYRSEPWGGKFEVLMGSAAQPEDQT